MRKALRYVLNGSMIVLLLLQSGCGAIELLSHASNTEKEEDWFDWMKCPNMPLSLQNDLHSVYCLKRDAYAHGVNPKPPVLLLHELSGLTPEALRYAAELSQDFAIYLPVLFGEKGKRSFLNWKGLTAYWFGNEWSIPSEGSAPIVKWLRDVVSDIEAKHESSSVRIIGNCMTGALPLALLGKADGTVNARIDAVIVAQPVLPIKFWRKYTNEDHSSLDLSNKDMEIAHSSTAKILALRFQTDKISSADKQKTLREVAKDHAGRLVAVEICAKDYEPEGKEVKAHSTLIEEYDAVGKVGELSMKTRETVRRFLLKPSSFADADTSCPPKFGREMRLESER